MKLIDADKLREQIEKLQLTSERCMQQSARDNEKEKFTYWDGANDCALQLEGLIKAAPDLSLTWEDVRQLVRTADSIITRETGKYRDEQAYYEEVLRRFNAEK